MKNLFFYITYIFLSISLLTSCSTGKIESIYHSPSNIASVGLKEKNDFKFKGNVTVAKPRTDVESADPTKLLEGNISWSPIKHLGIYANTHRYGESFTESFKEYGSSSVLGWTFPTTSTSYTHHKFNSQMSEFGLGYYNQINPYLSAELYGFYGKGKGEHSSSDKEFNYKVRKIGLRGSLTSHIGGSDIGASLAISKLKFHHFENTYDAELYSRARYLTQRPNQNLVQFGAFYKYNFKYFELRGEIGSSQSFGTSQFKQNNNYISIGGGINIHNLINKMKN